MFKKFIISLLILICFLNLNLKVLADDVFLLCNYFKNDKPSITYYFLISDKKLYLRSNDNWKLLNNFKVTDVDKLLISASQTKDDTTIIYFIDSILGEAELNAYNNKLHKQLFTIYGYCVNPYNSPLFDKTQVF